MSLDGHLRKLKEAYSKESREARKREKMIELEVVSKSKSDLISDKLIAELVYLWTCKDGAEQRKVFARTPKGKHWAQILAEKSRDYMRQVAQQMTDSDLQARLEDMRILENLRSVLSNVIYDILESKKKTEAMSSV